MTENNPVHGAPDQQPEANPEKPVGRREEKLVYNWPDSLTVHHLITELATEQAADEMERESEAFRFRTSMHGHSPDLGRSLQLAPGINAAIEEAVSGYLPSNMLYEILDREMRALAETARDLLPEEQWDRLRNAAKEDLQRKIQDQAARA